MPHLSISLFGSFHVTLGGQPVTGFESDKARALLVFLAVESGANGQGQPHRRESLAGLLWPDSPEPSARQSLSQALSNLRQTLQDRETSIPFILVTRPDLQWNPQSSYDLDVAAFACLLDECKAQRANHQANPLTPETCCLERAMSLYQGSLMAGFSLAGSSPFEEWLLLQRERFDRLAQEALERLIYCCQERGEVERALGHAWRWVELDPWQEEAHQQLMRLLASSGQRSAALAQYEICCRALREELGVEPQEKTTQLYEQIRDGKLGQETRLPAASRPQEAGPPQKPFHNLPASLTPLIGRENELAQVLERLQDPACRLLTLLGLGGMGKTHLALEAATRLLSVSPAFPDGIYIVPLVGVSSAEGIMPAIAEAIGFSFSSGMLTAGTGRPPRPQLTDYLRQKKVLLILDNFEHLLDGVEMLTDVLKNAPGVRLMVTSRVRLNAQGEYVLPLEGLAFAPEHGETGFLEETRFLESFPAIQLFLATARRICPHFTPTPEDLAAVARISRMVEGMPLALILAAGWIEALSPVEIAAEMAAGAGQEMDVLSTTSGDLPPRLRSMRAVFDQSWALVDERRREVFRGLSVFRGGFTRQAAQVVTGATLDELMTLVNKARLHRTPAGRFEMHELMRQYAQERLEQTPDGGRTVRDRHSAYYLGLCKHWEADLKCERQRTALEEMDLDIGNARTAWDWAAEQRYVAQLDLATESLGAYYDRRVRYQEGESGFRLAAGHLQSASLADELRVLIKLTTWQAIFAPDAQTFRQLGRQCLSLLERPELAGQDIHREKALALRTMSFLIAGSDYEKQVEVLEESLALSRAIGDQYEEAVTLHLMALRAYFRYGYDRAMQKAQEALAIRKKIRDTGGIAITSWALSATTWIMGQEESEHWARECIAAGEESGNSGLVAIGLWMLGLVFCLKGEFVQACLPAEQCLALCTDSGDRNGIYLANELFSQVRTYLGQYEQARAFAKEGHQVARSIEARAYVGRAITCAGMALLGQNQLQEAYQALAESTTLFREIGEVQVELGWALPLLGYAALGVQQMLQAKQVICESLQIGYRTRGFFSQIFSVSAAALLLAELGEKERAVEIYALALRYPFVANSRWFEDIAGRRIAAAAANLPPEVVAAAQARGRARDLQATVKELLEELG
ncbi:MAG: hypothetical protein JW934_18840 [Anaerolineae bacterium]|nr:hypothetical protein [Anaerolineae bacterium]